MWTRLGTTLAASIVGFVLVAGCSSAARGESCEDKGRIGGDCEEGLMCWHTKNDDVSPLVCLKPCVQIADCAEGEVCSGDNPKVCRLNR